MGAMLMVKSPKPLLALMGDETCVETAYRPRPKDFEEKFVEHGWDGIREALGAHGRQIKRWLVECGEDRLIAAREEYLRQTRWPNGVPGNRRRRYVMGQTLTKKVPR